MAVGCTASSPSPSAPAPTGEPSAEPPACEGGVLRDPAGELVFLTGRWIGSGDPNALPAPSVFLFRQTNSCLRWVGFSAEDGEPLGESWVETFSGRIGSDFTIVGDWEEVPDGGKGALTADIELVHVGDGYDVEITLADSSGDIHRTKHWVREDAEP